MIGSRIQHYRVTEKLGEGGMGVVYLAEDTRLGRNVAIKFLPREATASDQDRQRFEQEARAAARLNHPNICTVHAFDEHEGRPFLVMEYVEGTTLRERLREGTLPREAALDYAVQICEALADAHAAGIVHRDIKPGNLMVTPKGRVKVTDFGLAKLRGGDRITKTESTLGTMAYMAPEQIQGKEVDHRADIFAFGVVLYEMLTGTHPFAAEYEQAVAYRLVNEEPVPPSSLRPDIDPKLNEITARCLAKARDHRYVVADDIINDLRGKEKATHPPASMFAHLSQLLSGRQLTRPRATWGVAIGIVLLAVSLLLLPRWRGGEDREAIPHEKHIVVLPFANLSEEAIPQSLSDGIMELLTSKITQMELHEGSLWVVPSSEVRHEQVSSVTEAARLFGANLAITGSVQRRNDDFRLTMNLVDGSTMRQLRSSVLELGWTDFARLQDELARALSSILELEMTPSVVQTITAGGSADPRAYRLYTEGRGYLSRHDDVDKIQLAIQKFEEALEVDAAFVRAHAGLGEAYWRMYEATSEREWTQKAIDHGRKAIELDDQATDAHITMSLIYNGTGRYADALRILNQLQEPDDISSAALRERARAYEGQGRLDRAEEAYLQAVAQKPSYWEGYNRLGTFYYRHGRLEEAAEAFQKVIDLTPDNTRGYSNLGAMYFGMQRYEEATRAFEQSLEIRPTDAALANLGTLYFYEGRYGDAIEQYEQALERSAADYNLWGNLGSAYYWSGADSQNVRTAMDRAIALAEQAREVRPNDPQLLARLAGFHALLGEHERARTLLDQVTAMDAIDTESKALIAEAYEQLGARDTALHWIEEALAQGYRVDRLEIIPGLAPLLEDPRMMRLRIKHEYQLPNPPDEHP